MSGMKPHLWDQIVRLPKELLASDSFGVVFLQLHEDKAGHITGAMTLNHGRGIELHQELHGSRERNELSLWSSLPGGETTPPVEVALADDGSFTMSPPPGSSGPTLHFKPASRRQYQAALKQRQA